MSLQILFDIGANEGKYTDANMKNFDKYILVEANPVLAENLREKYRTNTSVYIKSDDIFDYVKSIFK